MIPSTFHIYLLTSLIKHLIKTENKTTENYPQFGITQLKKLSHIISSDLFHHEFLKIQYDILSQNQQNHDLGFTICMDHFIRF